MTANLEVKVFEISVMNLEGSIVTSVQLASSYIMTIPKQNEQTSGHSFDCFHKRAPTSSLQRLEALEANNWTHNHILIHCQSFTPIERCAVIFVII